MNMNLLVEKYIIVEVIPTAISREKGDLVQLSALKLEGLKLLERFDYRLNEDKILLDDFKKMIDYDKDSFKYKETTEEILEDFGVWSNGLPILILDNKYTNNFLEKLSNEKISISYFLHEEYSDDLIERLINKYNILPTNYIVDILYEALIKNL